MCGDVVYELMQNKGDIMKKFFNRMQIITFVLAVTLPAIFWLILLMFKRIALGAFEGFSDFIDYDTVYFFKIPSATIIALKNGTGLNWSALKH